KQSDLRGRSRPCPPSRSCLARPQRTRSTVPVIRQFLHNAPWLSSVSRCLGPTQRRDPVSSSFGGQPHHLPRLEHGPLRHLDPTVNAVCLNDLLSCITKSSVTIGFDL